MHRKIILLSLVGIFFWMVSAGQALEMARYRGTFTATWTETSHPVDFPDSAHWSPLIGGVHNDQAVFWEPGGVSSRGIQDMAELGTTSALANEVTAQISAGNALAVVRGRSIPSGDGTAEVEFDVTDAHPLVTLTSMVAPSPDWFVGVHGLNLREENGWIGKTVVDLFPYDAGTDSGATFTSFNLVTVPRGVITRINSPPLENPLPMGTLTFVRLIPHDYNTSGDWDAADIDELSAAVRGNSTDSKYDVNGDQTVNADDRAAWISDVRRTCIGDSNLDGAFTSSDLVAVFTAGQYEDAIAGNSTWATGDWDGDAEFSSADFVKAFQAGCYELTPVAPAAVPEPTGGAALLALIGCMLARIGVRSTS